MDKLDIPQGTLDLMILTILAREPMHGYGISQRLAVLSRDNFHVNPGSLFPSLYRLEQDGRSKPSGGASENNRNAKYYKLTAAGAKAARPEQTTLGSDLVCDRQRPGGRMRLLHRFASVVRWIFRRGEAERSWMQELQGFIELSVADKVRDGLSPAEARRLAVLELGGVEQAKEQVRTYRHGGWLDEVGRDVRYALRMFVRNPAFSLVVVATLALGIGANTAIFGLIDALMLRWLPVRNPQELVQLRCSHRGRRAPGEESFSYAIVRALSDQRQIFSAVGGFTASSFDVGAAGATTRVTGALVTGDYYATLGLTPADRAVPLADRRRAGVRSSP